MITDNIDQPVCPHPDFFIPLDLRIPEEDKKVLNERIIEQLRIKHANSKRLWFNSSHALEHSFEATKAVADGVLNPLDLEADALGIFIVNPNIYDRNIHSDAGRLESRLNFYEMTTAPGGMRWFTDTGDGYDSYTKNFEGVEVLDRTWPWVMDFKANKITWEDLPPVLHSTSTTCPSALVRTDYPHHVIQGPGLRVTVTCRVVDRKTRSLTGTWARIKEAYSTL